MYRGPLRIRFQEVVLNARGWRRTSLGSKSSALTEIVAPLKRIIAGRGNWEAPPGTGFPVAANPPAATSATPSVHTFLPLGHPLDKMPLPSPLDRQLSPFARQITENDGVTCLIPISTVSWPIAPFFSHQSCVNNSCLAVFGVTRKLSKYFPQLKLSANSNSRDKIDLETLSRLFLDAIRNEYVADYGSGYPFELR